MSNINELKPIISLNPFARFCCTIGNLPSSYMASLTYEEQLLWLCDYLENTIIPTVNNNAECVKELQELYVKLKNYVDNYFNNLDIQIEVNKKLDEMALDGTLENIINQEIFGEINNNINNLDSKLNSINSNINNNINNLDSKLNSINSNINRKLFKKFIKATYPYNSNLDFIGNNHSISSELLFTDNKTLSVQGIAYNSLSGKILGNNGNQIFEFVKNYSSGVDNRRILFEDDYGHGGDCAIINNNMYISDGQTNSIFKVNLETGNKIQYKLNEEKIRSENPFCVLGGICFDESDEYCYIAVYDDSKNTSIITSGNNTRIYKYDFSNNYELLLETHLDVVYLQGFTCDEEGFYLGGNKPFEEGSNYNGNNLYIINKFSLEIVDKLENTLNREFEGLDYCSINGNEGILTEYCLIGNSYQIILLTYYGNVTCTKVLSKDNIILHLTWKSNIISVLCEINNVDIAKSSNYTINNFFDDTILKKFSNGDIPYVTQGYGQSRNINAYVEYNGVSNNLIIRTLDTNTQNMTKIRFSFTFFGNIV